MVSPNTQAWIDEERAKARTPRITEVNGVAMDTVGAKMLDTLSDIIDRHLDHDITTREAVLLILKATDYFHHQLGPRWLL